MKKLLFLLLPMFLLACQKKYDGFDMVYRKEFLKPIPVGASTVLSHYFLLENINPNYATFAKNNATSELDVKRIIPKFMRLSAKFGDANFDFVYRVYVNIFPANNPSKKVEVFYREDVPLNTNTILDLNAGLADAKKYLDKDEPFNIEIRMDFRSPPPRNVETIVDFSFFAVTSE